MIDVPIETLLTFNKLKKITEDKEIIAKAAKASTILKVDETNSNIARATPVPKVRDVDNRTVFAVCLLVKTLDKFLNEIVGLYSTKFYYRITGGSLFFLWSR